MRVAYLDCFAGMSGDMFLGALVDAGVPLPVLQEAIAALALDAALRVETVDRSGISSTKVHVLEGGELAEERAPHAHGELHSHSHEHGKHDHGHGEEGHEHSHEHAGEVRTHSHEHEEHSHEEHEHGEPKHSHELKHSHEHGEEHGHEAAHSHEHGHDHEHGHKHGVPHVHGRSLSKIRELIEGAALPAPVKQRAIRTFELLGHSEAKIHNVPVEEIHFHEVGAVDAIADIVAACAGVEHLCAEGPVQWFASPVNVGGGMVECAHGTFPVPAPATADLLRGVPTYSAHVEKELVTPTGAALLRMLEPSFAAQPPMAVHSIGYGAGTRNPHGFPNVLRLSIGESAGGSEAPPQQTMKEGAHGHQNGHQGEIVTVLETALDDSTPQVLAHVAERALADGALDVMLTPVIMKKGRPGTLITLLCNAPDAAALEDLLLRETSTLGVRMHRQHRSCLERTRVAVETPYGEIRIKTGTRDGQELNAAPEFEDCRSAATQNGVAVKQVMQAAMAAFLFEKVR